MRVLEGFIAFLSLQVLYLVMPMNSDTKVLISAIIYSYFSGLINCAHASIYFTSFYLTHYE